MLNLDLEAGGNVRTWDTFSLCSQVKQFVKILCRIRCIKPLVSRLLNFQGSLLPVNSRFQTIWHRSVSSSLRVMARRKNN